MRRDHDYSLHEPCGEQPLSSCQAVMPGQRGLASASRVLGLVLRWCVHAPGSRWMQRVCLIGLGLYMVRSMREEWTWFRLGNDTPGYVAQWFPGAVRGPLYPWFISLTQIGHDFNHECAPYHSKQLYREDCEAPLLRIVRAQKVLHVAAFLYLSWVCLRSFSPAVVVLLAGLLHFDFVGQWNAYVLTECLSEALFFVLIGQLLQYMRTRKQYTIMAMGCLLGILFQLRPASIFGAVLLLPPLLMEASRGCRRMLVGGAGAATLALLLGLSPQAATYVATGRLELSGLSPLMSIGAALYVAGPDDLSAMETDDEREFLSRALARIASQRAADLTRREAPAWRQMDDNRWLIAPAVADDMGLGHDERQALFSATGHRIEARHRAELFAVSWDNFKQCFRRSRTWPIPWFFVSTGLIVGLAVYAGDGLAVAGLAMWAARLAAFAVFAFCQPALRYVGPTEVLTILGAFLVAHQAIRRLFSGRFRCMGVSKSVFPMQG